MRSTALILSTSLASTSAFSLMTRGSSNTGMKTKTQASSVSPELDDKNDQNKQKIFDPLGLYPQESPERQFGSIQPLESSLEQDRAIIDPLSLYQDGLALTNDVVMSASLPFLKRPENLDGRLPGDRGFDPFNFSSDLSALNWYRESEIKHARLAMLASVGWIVSELTHNNIASQLDVKSILGVSDRVPSILNGGLDQVNPMFWVSAISAAAALEFISTKNYGDRQPGDFGFDPSGLAGKNHKEKFLIKEAEIFNGRLAMLGITGFAVQEFFTNDAVINQLPGLKLLATLLHN